MAEMHGPFTSIPAAAPSRDAHEDANGNNGAVKVLRRIITALFMTGAAAAALRVKGRGGTPPQHGGWRPISIADGDAP
jgi:hypothetical protein